MAVPQDKIRNFSIIAHIDHGKSTLADRLLEVTGTLKERDAKAQFLDKMDLERERGITIKAQAVRLDYKAKDGQVYQLNLIDTPGHVDFHYEVSRSLSACEGVILVVDAAQGVEAQTLANVYLALDANLEIVPVLNKIDLPVARPDEVKKEIEDTIGLDASNAILASAKTGIGIEEILEAIVERIPPPRGSRDAVLRALVFDSWYDSYKGAVALVRVVDGAISTGQKVRFMSTGKTYEVTTVGVMAPFAMEVGTLVAGEVGFFTASVKEVADTKVGDTITDAANSSILPLPGFKEMKPMVFAGLYPTDPADYGELRDALEKLRLNDSSITWEPESSEALGFGYRTGFLGLLHMEIVQERLEREFNLGLITTAPSVRYRVILTDQSVLEVDNPARIPDLGKFESIEEPIITTTVHVPQEYVGSVMTLCQERRGVQKNLHYGTGGRVMVTYEMPLAEVVFGFYDRLKTMSRGYASMDYEPAGYKEADLIRLDLLVNGDKVDALSIISHREFAFKRGHELTTKLKELIPRQMFDVAVQAAIGTKVIARVNVKALRKNVTAKCYGGDITRKKKLLEKQKEGKRRMKSVGNVEIPQEAFLAVLKVD